MQPVVHSTFAMQRHYPVPPEKVFAAFADPGKKRRWFVDGEHNEVEEYSLDFRVGGKETARFRFKEGIPIAGMVCLNETSYLALVPNSRIVFLSSMTIGGRCISATLVTVELTVAGTGTDLLLTHQGAFFEGADGPAMREEGWRVLLERLAAETA